MIRFKIKQLLAEKEFRERRRITLSEVSEESGVNRATLSRLVNRFGYSTDTDVLGRLCAYFSCEVGELAEYVRDEKQREARKAQAAVTNRAARSRR